MFKPNQALLGLLTLATLGAPAAHASSERSIANPDKNFAALIRNSDRVYVRQPMGRSVSLAELLAQHMADLGGMEKGDRGTNSRAKNQCGKPTNDVVTCTLTLTRSDYTVDLDENDMRVITPDGDKTMILKYRVKFKEENGLKVRRIIGNRAKIEFAS